MNKLGRNSRIHGMCSICKINDLDEGAEKGPNDTEREKVQVFMQSHTLCLLLECPH